jgi:PAS domain S-box-containing protein
MKEQYRHKVTTEKRIKRFVLALGCFWTVVVLLSFAWSAIHLQNTGMDMAKVEAATAYESDVFYKKWNAMHGGVYVPVSENTPPNPFLTTNRRDVVTTNGEQLTLINPAYMARQVNELQEESPGLRGHLTSLKPMRPQNAPDAWEREGLLSFEQGAHEAYAIREVDGEKYFRLIRPMYVEEACLRCHSDQGYKVGDVRGGIGVSIPIRKTLDIVRREQVEIAGMHGLLWFLGITVLWLGSRRLYASVRDCVLAERRLIDKEAKFRAIFEQANDPIWLVNLESGRIEAFNDQAHESLGYSREEYKNLQLADIEANPSCEEVQRHAERMETVGWDVFETQHRTKGGEIREVSVSTRLLALNEKKYALSILRDTTEQKQAEKERLLFEMQLGQTQKLESLGVMAGGIAHDFNNILQTILGNADLVLRETPPNSKQSKRIEAIQVASRRAGELTDQMLAYSGKGAIEMKQIDLSRVVQEMAQLLEISHSKRTALRYAFEENLPAIEADTSQLRQIVMNLVVNASEAIGDESGLVSVSTGAIALEKNNSVSIHPSGSLPEGRYVYLKVSDTGCGMSDDVQRRLFEPFYTTKFSGRGLGMAAVLGIVKAHKGALSIKSSSGEGASVEVYFPALDKPMEVFPEESPEDEWRGRGTVLVVDDEPQLLKVQKLTLEHKGFSVLTASDGVEAIELYEKHAEEITCVLLDLMMPRMGGEEAYAELRRIQADVPIILMSGYNDSDLDGRVTNADGVEFLKKPCASKTLFEKIYSVMYQSPVS